ncbi:MAG: IclR family transcriptional regulator [Granulosicoccus sp.]|nr:IclR family transcriptional regulator [Granulosicoccus sp.]
MSSEKSAFGVPPVARAFQLLRYIGEGNNCASPSQAARESGINRTTLLRLLQTLQEQKMIESDGRRGYVLGAGLIHLAHQALQSRDVVTIAQPVLKKLAHQLGLSAHLGIAEGSDILYLLRETPNLHLVSNVRVGSRLPIHATTIGRILLAHQSAAERAKLLSGMELYAVTARTPTTIKVLEKQLVNDRRAGTAWSEGNFEPAIGSAATAVFDATQTVVAGINVTGPVSEFTDTADRKAEIEKALRRAAESISAQLGYFPEKTPVEEKEGLNSV